MVADLLSNCATWGKTRLRRLFSLLNLLKALPSHLRAIVQYLRSRLLVASWLGRWTVDVRIGRFRFERGEKNDEERDETAVVM